ncbi:MAG: ABC transporter permease [Anaerolineales bacterium]|nr:ABC transporter permease [Anaerolineales bacterium]
MLRLLIRRLFALVPVLLGVAVIVFFIIRLVPGDAVDIMLGEYNDPEVAARIRQFLGLDQPVPVQFVRWVTGMLRGDLGISIRTGRAVTTEIAQRLPATMQLAGAAVIFSLLIGVPFGVISATHRNTTVDFIGRVFSLGGISMPHFWLGILLILVFAVTLRLLPSGGYVAPAQDLEQNLRHLVMPTVTLGYSMAAVTMRMTRSAVLEVLSQDHVRTARAKGLVEHLVIRRHVLRNALIPVVTVVGIQVGHLLGGTVVIEEVFSWPGIGSLVVRAILQRDYPLVQGVVLILATLFVLTNLVVDILYGFLDPRLRAWEANSA